MTMDKETEILKTRLLDLGNRAYRNAMFTFSPFLSLADQQLLEEIKKELGNVKISLCGGHELPERVMARFGDPEELGYEEDFPIVCIHIRPLLKKFADQLSHRDFLGAFMNLSIERNTLGDILIEDKEAYLFCNEKVADYILEELTTVKHTKILAERLEKFDIKIPKKEPVIKELLVSSLRIDSVLAKVYQLSRSEAVLLFREKKVFVNGKLQESNSYFLKEEDMVTARGYGRFIFKRQISVTKKEKLKLEIAKFE